MTRSEIIDRLLTMPVQNHGHAQGMAWALERYQSLGAIPEDRAGECSARIESLNRFAMEPTSGEPISGEFRLLPDHGEV